jgi:hypothetical protein
MTNDRRLLDCDFIWNFASALWVTAIIAPKIMLTISKKTAVQLSELHQLVRRIDGHQP